MPRQDVLSTNFSGGELSPRLYGRPDLQKYGDSVKLARDVVALQHGGMTGRPGTDLLDEVKDSADQTRLIPFVYSATDAYALEFGDGYMRVWRDGALIESSPGTPYEISTPYSAARVQEMDFTQGADTMFIAHQEVAMRRLRRFGDAAWVMDTAPFDPAPFSEIGMRGSATLTLGSAAVGSTTCTASGSTFLAGDVGRSISYAGGSATITAYTSTTSVDVDVTVAFVSTTMAGNAWLMSGSPRTTCTPSAETPVGKSITLTLGAAGWRTADVGGYVQLNGGLVRIDSRSSSTIVDGTIIQEMTGTTAAEADAWSLERAVWNSQDGYPGSVTLHQQRLVAGGSPRWPQTIWGSQPGLYLNFVRGVDDDAAYSHELASDEINPIRFLSSNRDLIVLTYGGEWTINGGLEKPITATNIRAIPQAKVGSDGVRPEQIDDDLYYVQRGGGVLRTVSWNAQFGGYQSGEASTFSEHLVRNGVASISYQQSPERVAWCLIEDGTYVAMTVSREQNIRALTLCTAGGAGVVESMCSIPEGTEDSTYMIVRRTINGATKRYVERMAWAANQDCRTVLTPASASLTGLTAYAGADVSVVADGIDIGTYTVSAAGEVTLPRVANEASVGFRFTPRIKLLSTETGTGMGASLGGSKMQGRVKVLFRETVGCSVNGQPLAFRQLGEDVLDNPVAPYTGWKDVSNFGWAVDADEIEITQPQSYPITVLAVVRRITSNPG